tara:strand:+ start:399 stop:1043 length:645 start_codon:yes stop_codon:yes gene_type:complete
MGTRPNENWEARTIDSRSPKFRIDVANPEMGAEGADVYKIYAVTDNDDVNLCALSEGGKYKIHNDKSMEIVAGMTNTEGGVDIVIAGMKGDILITAMRDGQVKIKGANIAIQADEDIDLIAGRNINVNGKAKVMLKGNKVQADGLIGNLVESTSGSFIMRVFEGGGRLPDDAKIGMDYLASPEVTEALGAKTIAGIGNPSAGLAANVLGSFFQK